MRRVAVALVLVALSAASCARDGATSLGPGPSVQARPSQSPSAGSPSPTGTSPSASPTVSPTASPGGRTITLQAWFLRGGKLFVTERTSPYSVAVGRLSLEGLTAGPTSAEAAAGITTAISAGSTFSIVALAGGLATVDTNMPTGPSTRSAQAQVVVTLTQFSTIQRVRFGTGSELTRGTFADLFPAIVVESPAIGTVVSSPLSISGTADVFEATVSIRVLDAEGNELASSFTTATCGTGCRGDYAATVRFSVDHQQTGTVEVFDYSAKDGSVENLQRIPVVLVP